jgi:Icc-related predicted phosphoesterase
MTILFFSDIHSDLAALERLMAIEADRYFCAGDLVNWAKGLAAAGEVLARKASQVSIIPGNHESPEQIETFCAEYGFTPMHGRVEKIGDFHLAALGCSNPTPFDTPGEYTEEELAARLQPFAALDNLLLVCHCPPKGTQLDRAGDSRHFGSTAVAEFIERNQPLQFFCGHIHEAAGVEQQLGRTVGRNVGKKGFLLKM